MGKSDKSGIVVSEAKDFTPLTLTGMSTGVKGRIGKISAADICTYVGARPEIRHFQLLQYLLLFPIF